jgi:ketosteroid isomerase-like protein
MSLTPAEIAEAFSSHRFSEAYPQIADDVEWRLVGGPTLAGKAALVEDCEDTERELSNTQTMFTRFRSIVGDRTVVVDSVAEYQAPDGSTTAVASCDLYDFDGETVVAITSYTVELPAARRYRRQPSHRRAR